MGRVDAALLHGTALPSPVFRAVMGVWLQTNPSAAKKQQCLSCHAPAVTIFPQHTDRIIEQVLSGKVTVEGISCAPATWSKNSPMIPRRSRPIN